MKYEKFRNCQTNLIWKSWYLFETSHTLFSGKTPLSASCVCAWKYLALALITDAMILWSFRLQG